MCQPKWKDWLYTYNVIITVLIRTTALYRVYLRHYDMLLKFLTLRKETKGLGVNTLLNKITKYNRQMFMIKIITNPVGYCK